MRLSPRACSALALGLALTAFQLVVACLLAPGGSLKETYSRLCAWDCAWYEEIAREGYHSTIPPVPQNWNASNVAFFPGYPYLARLLCSGLRLEPRIGLLLVAQAFCALFWALLWILLKRWKIPTLTAALVVLAILAHPAAFYLVSGYSESLFLASLLLFLLSSDIGIRRNPRWQAALSGFVMSATRIVGILAAAYPALREFSSTLIRGRLPSARRFARPLLLSLIAASGTALFLAYCQARFGHHDLYMQTQRIGWGIVPDYAAILKWSQFHFLFPFDRFATVASGIAFILLAGLELLVACTGPTTGLRKRLPVYLVAFLIFYITLSGLKSVAFVSMVRYTLPWFILLALCLAHLSARLHRAPRPVAYAAFLAVISGSVLSYLFQLAHFRDFLHGLWFA